MVRLLLSLDVTMLWIGDNRWDRVEKAYNVLTKGEGEQAESAVAAMDASYAKDVTDEFFSSNSHHREWETGCYRSKIRHSYFL